VKSHYGRPTVLETFGLSPLRERARQAVVALRGAEHVPPSKFDRTSLRMLQPRIALPLWAGRFPIRRTVIITILFNRRQTPVEEGWSVRRTQVEDFRGKTLTYDSHNGTDFAIPIGTPVTAAAPGRVARVYSEFNRGGLKVQVDHGSGLMTTSGHLARALVREGDMVRRGQTIALSGYSGLDGFTTFPWGVPHVHFNTWLNGVPVDPFARRGDATEASLWRGGEPTAAPEGEGSEDYSPSVFREDAVASVIEGCRSEATRTWLRKVPREARAGYVVSEMNYYPTRFPVRENVYNTPFPRTPRLTMPFRPEDVDGFVFGDER
jgi:murein DD-endopeptidase